MFKNKLIDNTMKYHSVPCKYTRQVDSIEKAYNVWLYCGRIDIMSDVGNKLMERPLTMSGGLMPDFVVYWRYDATSKQYWISMRSIDTKTNVSEICTLYGGGGHRNASGCSLPGNTILEDVFVPAFCL